MKLKNLLTLFVLFLLFNCQSNNDKEIAPEVYKPKVYTGHLELTTQNQVDDFGAKGYTEIIGSLTIRGNDINDLSLLIKLKKISVNLALIENEKLSSLKGLDSINYLGALYICCNNVLESVAGLNNLQAAEGGIILLGNSKLMNLNGLEKLNTINSMLQIANNPALTNINGLKNLKVVPQIDIKGNSSLQNLDGLGSINSKLELLLIDSNSSLTSISGLKNITEVDRSLSVTNNKVTNLTGLNKLISAGNLSISHNSELENIDALEKLTIISNGAFRILRNSKLSNLNGLKNLTSPVKIGLTIIGNQSLTDFCGLKSWVVNNLSQSDFQAESNGYNPTKDDILTDKCKN